jgi:lipid-A-disaccharide synthase
MAEKNILIVCGEPSGDLHAANLIKAIKEIDPEVTVCGVGGDLLHRQGVKIIRDINELSVMGLFDTLLKLPSFFKLRDLILKQIQDRKIAAVILVDFSGFNLRLAQKINKSVPTIYYISPQVWASRPGRLQTIKSYVDRMLVIFKFEEEFYRRNNLKVDFVGCPLLDIVKPAMEKKDFLSLNKLSENKTTIALLPGSRRAEVENILPIMLQASMLIQKEIPNTQFIVAKSPQVDSSLYAELAYLFDLPVTIIEGKTYECLNISDFCLICSGTATIEAAIMQKPFFIIYKMGLLNYLLYRPQVKLPYIGMVNIVAGKKIIPEFIQFRAQPEVIAKEAVKIIKNKPALLKMQGDLALVKSSLGTAGAARRAAEIILGAIKTKT